MNEISIHALHEESDAVSVAMVLVFVVFQSTLSMRRATGITLDWGVSQRISIHALHEESDQHADHHRGRDQTISIHALHEESDAGMACSWWPICDFNPRSP